jgi:hypothetical protein
MPTQSPISLRSKKSRAWRWRPSSTDEQTRKSLAMNARFPPEVRDHTCLAQDAGTAPLKTRSTVTCAGHCSGRIPAKRGRPVTSAADGRAICGWFDESHTAQRRDISAGCWTCWARRHGVGSPYSGQPRATCSLIRPLFLQIGYCTGY